MSRSLTPSQTQDHLARGFRYLDVRSREEFDEGHVPGSLNVPLLVGGAMGQVDPGFVQKVGELLALSDPVVVGCATGQRSRVATRMLAHAGFSNVFEMPAGFLGAKDAFGRRMEGWVQCGLPVEGKL